jgi:Predicted membrane protein (DUF2142)
MLAFVGFFLLHAGWSFATPYNGPPDEVQHALRTAGILNGEIIGERNPKGAIQTVPASLSVGWCFPTKVGVAADCEREPGGDQSPLLVNTSAGRYNPVYYVVTGWPLGPWPNWTGILLSRLLNGAVMAALLACAVVGAARWSRHRALLAGAVVAITPMVAHLGGAINPSGVEIAAAVALFVALIAMVHEQQEGVNRVAVALAGVSACAVVTSRFTGVLWLAVILGVVLVPSSWARVKALARSRTVRAWSLVVGLSVVASLAWTSISGSADPASGDRGYPAIVIMRTALLDMWPNVANQMVGVMGWAETLMPRLVYVVWFAAVGLLVLGGLVLGNRVERWRLLALFFGTFTPLLAMEILTANQIGWFNQGRYFLPGAVGLPLLGAYILARHGGTAEQMRTLTRGLAVLLLPIHLGCLAYTMCRWQSGLRSLNPLEGSWSPPYGSVLPLALASGGIAVLMTFYWLASRIPPAPPAMVEGREPVRAAAAEPVGVGRV